VVKTRWALLQWSVETNARWALLCPLPINVEDVVGGGSGGGSGAATATGGGGTAVGPRPRHSWD